MPGKPRTGRPGGVARNLMPHHQQLGILGRLTPGPHHQAAEQASHHQADDREDHLAMMCNRGEIE